MNMTELLGFISTNGFAIVMCLILFRYINTTQKDLITKLGEISLNISKLCTMIDQKRDPD